MWIIHVTDRPEIPPQDGDRAATWLDSRSQAMAVYSHLSQEQVIDAIKSVNEGAHIFFIVDPVDGVCHAYVYHDSDAQHRVNEQAYYDAFNEREQS